MTDQPYVKLVNNTGEDIRAFDEALLAAVDRGELPDELRDMMARHIQGELSRASDSAASEIDYLIERLHQAKKELARDPSWAASASSSLGQAMSQVHRGLADLAAKSAAVKALHLVTKTNGDDQ